MISVGLRTLLLKEVRRFLRVPGQTLLSPVITTTLYFVVFGWSLGGRLREVEGVPYARFIVPGLVTLGVVTNAYLNSSSSLFVLKIQGTIVDLLVSPLRHAELLAGFLGAAVVRGLLVGLVMWGVAGVFEGFEVAHPALAVVLLLLAAVSFSALGFIAAGCAQLSRGGASDDGLADTAQGQSFGHASSDPRDYQQVLSDPGPF